MRCLAVSGHSYPSKYRIGFALNSLRSVTPQSVDVGTNVHIRRKPFAIDVFTLFMQKLILAIAQKRSAIIGVHAQNGIVLFDVNNQVKFLLYYVIARPIHILKQFFVL